MLYVHCLIELVGDVALHEDRWVVHVLNADACANTSNSASPNGPAVTTGAEAVHK